MATPLAAASGTGSPPSTRRTGSVGSFTEADDRSEQHRRRRGRGLGPEHRGQHRLAHRPQDQAGRQDVRARRPAERSRGRRGSALGRERRRALPQLHGQHLAGRSRLGGVTRTVKLPDTHGGRCGEHATRGFPGSRSAPARYGRSTPTTRISRIDPETGRLVATIDVRRGLDHRGRRGGGLVPRAGTDRSVRRLDPRTNRVAETIPLGSHSLSGIAVGAGSVWATAQDEGLLWRIEAGPEPEHEDDRRRRRRRRTWLSATGRSGPATTSTASSRASTPRTNSVTATRAGRRSAGARGRRRVGLGQRCGRDAGRRPAGVDLHRGRLGGQEAGRPDRLRPALQGPRRRRPRGDGRRDPLRARDNGFRAGEYAVGYQSCDDSTAQSGQFEDRKCAANANAYACAERLVAVIGPWNSGCAEVEIPILNRAPGGPLALDQPFEHPPQPDPRRPAFAATPARAQGRAGGLLPHRYAQLRPGPRPRRPAGRGARDARKAARTEGRLPAPRSILRRQESR